MIARAADRRSCARPPRSSPPPPSRSRTGSGGSRPAPPRRSRMRAAPAAARPNPPRRRSSRSSAPRTWPSGRPSTGPCPRRRHLRAAPSPVGVHDDLAAGESRVGPRPAADEAACGIDQVLDRRRVGEVGGQRGENHIGLQPLAHLLDRRRRLVLRGEDDRVDVDRPPVLVLHRDLALAVGPRNGSVPSARQAARRMLIRCASRIGSGISSLVSSVA